MHPWRPFTSRSPFEKPSCSGSFGMIAESASRKRCKYPFASLSGYSRWQMDPICTNCRFANACRTAAATLTFVTVLLPGNCHSWMCWASGLSSGSSGAALGRPPVTWPEPNSRDSFQLCLHRASLSGSLADSSGDWFLAPPGRSTGRAAEHFR